MLPFVHVRDNPHVTKEEWQWVKSTDMNMDFLPTTAQVQLHSQLSTAIQTLLHDLDIDSDLVPGHRLYHAEILQPSDKVSIILILPRPEEVCSAPTGSAVLTDNSEQRRGCSSIPIPVFEMIHQCTYQPEFIAMYCRLSIFLEHFIMVRTIISQYEQRKCLLENDAKVYKAQYDCLCEFQKKLDDIWKNARWISRIASEARDKHVSVENFTIEKMGNRNYECLVMKLNYLYYTSFLLCTFRRLYLRQKISYENHRRSLSAEKNPEINRTVMRGEKTMVGVVVVYAAYDCGLPRGTSVRLSIAGNTTSIEVVNLVLEQLAKSIAMSMETEIMVPDLDDYCLVAVIGARERRLKDDFALLRLQNPWNKGKLFVRRRDAFLGAVQYGNEAIINLLRSRPYYENITKNKFFTEITTHQSFVCENIIAIHR
uniref:Ras-associating domain-containing protein n=1 Tax=Heterorhabditis bacteriophora TaxID=37862 RepID=A0A1I7WVE9_HETBA